MKTAGIIAEYNPFHNGHQYQMETVRHLTGADFVIVAMSGDFMQRGVPAIADKYTRTRMHFSAVPIWYSNFRLYGRPLPRNILLPEAYSFSEKQASLTRSAMAVKLRKKNLCRQLSKFFPKMLRTIRCWFLMT